MDATKRARSLSWELRHDRGPEMQRRRWLVGLSLVGVAAGQAVALLQTGIVKRLPDLPLPQFDATEVDKQPYGYKRLQTPDALLMIVSYGLTAVLAGAGGSNRARNQPWLAAALFGKVVYDAGLAVKLGIEEWNSTKKLCGYCQTATAVSLVSVGLAAVDAWTAFRALGERGVSARSNLGSRVPAWARGSAERVPELRA